MWLYKLWYLADQCFCENEQVHPNLNFQAQIRIFEIYNNHREFNSLQI